jgi:hypothetical protein
VPSLNILTTPAEALVLLGFRRPASQDIIYT